MILAIAVSELSQLVFILAHLSYYSDQVKTCPMDELMEGGVPNNILAFFYRILTIYIPIFTIMWTLWIPKNKVNIVFKEVTWLQYNLFIVYRAFLKSALTRCQDLLLGYLLMPKGKVHQKKTLKFLSKFLLMEWVLMKIESNFFLSHKYIVIWLRYLFVFQGVLYFVI